MVEASFSSMAKHGALPREAQVLSGLFARWQAIWHVLPVGQGLVVTTEVAFQARLRSGS